LPGRPRRLIFALSLIEINLFNDLQVGINKF